MTAATLAFWAFRIGLVEWVAREALEDSGLLESEFSIQRISWREIELRDARLAGKGWAVEMGRATVSYDPWESWNEKRVDGIEIFDAHFSVDLDEFHGEQSDELGPSSIDGVWEALFPLPFDSVRMNEAFIEMRFAGERVAASWSLEVERGPDETAFLRLALTSLDFDLGLESEFSALDRVVRIEGSGTVGEPLRWLEVLSPDELEGLEANSGVLQWEASGLLEGLDLASATGGFRLNGGRVAGDGFSLAVGALGGEFGVRDGFLTGVEGSGGLEAAEFGSAALMPASFDFELGGENLDTFALRSEEMRWIYDEDTDGSLAVRVEGVFAEDLESSQWELAAEVKEQRVAGYDLQPFELEAAGSLQRFAGATGRLSLEGFESVYLEGLSFEIADLLEDEMPIYWSSVACWEKYGLSPVVLQGEALSTETEFSWLGEGRNEQGVFARDAVGGELSGTWELSFGGAYRSDEESLDGNLKLGGSGLGGSWESARLEGAEFEAGLEARGLEVDRLSESLHGGVAELIDVLGAALVYEVSGYGNELEFGDEAEAKWFGFSLRSGEASGDVKGSLEANLGSVRYGVETLQQIAIDGAFEVLSGKIDYAVDLSGSLESEEVAARVAGELAFAEEVEALRGDFEVAPFRLRASDVVERHFPEFSGVSFSGELQGEGSYSWSPVASDMAGALRLTEGRVVYPDSDLEVKGLSGTLELASLGELKLRTSEAIEATELRYGDVVGRDFVGRFAMEGVDRFSVEQLELSLFEGQVYLQPTSFSLADLNADLRVSFEELSAEPVMRMIEFFDGVLMGRLSGFLPLSLVDGRFSVGEGFLELVDGSGGRLLYDAEGLFEGKVEPGDASEGLGSRILDRLGLNPENLVEESLADLPLETLRVDLFSRDFPGTPLRARVVGVADTAKVQVPLDITVNVNGTLQELLDFLFRVGSL